MSAENPFDALENEKLERFTTQTLFDQPNSRLKVETENGGTYILKGKKAEKPGEVDAVWVVESSDKKNGGYILPALQPSIGIGDMLNIYLPQEDITQTVFAEKTARIIRFNFMNSI